MYTIEIQNYPVFVRLGYFPQERLVGQEVLVSLLTTLTKEARPAVGDDLRRTVDYAALVGVVDRVLKGAEINLVETACDRVAVEILKAFALVAEIRVVIEKTMLPSGIAKGARVRVQRVLARQ